MNIMKKGNIAVAALSLKRKVTVSIGIAKCSAANTNRYDLIQRADVALSDAKKAGKNFVHTSG
jgi:PleD family two-component response regulator